MKHISAPNAELLLAILCAKVLHRARCFYFIHQQYYYA